MAEAELSHRDLTAAKLHSCAGSPPQIQAITLIQEAS
jgi:hypothetical protein